MAERAGDAVAAWEREADRLTWAQRWQHVPTQVGPDEAWFAGGRLNVAVNCLDRHLDERGDRIALHWEGEPGDRRSFTYRQLHAEVSTLATALHRLGVGEGSRVALYLGMVPETVVAMLACVRLGAVHCVLFSALPEEALADRLADLEPQVLITQDGSWRNGVVLPLKNRADEALEATAGVDHTIVVRRTGIDIEWFEGDRWYADVMAEARELPAVEPAVVAADDPLLVVHLANRRGRPTGIVHRSGGLLTHALTLHHALSDKPDDVFWCAVDIGWFAGQVHAVYGPLAAGGTTVLFEGTLDTPTRERAWQVLERYAVASLATTPSIVRRLRQWATSPPSSTYDLALTQIVTAGEAIDAAAAAWLRDEVGGGRVRLLDGWGQTELGAIVTVSPPAQPPLPDPGLDVVDDDGTPTGAGEVGELVLRHPWPATFLRIRHDDGDAALRYWRHPGAYTTGDAARRRDDGTIEILGRRDPVVNVSGQLVSANEVRDVIADHPFVAAVEVVARPDRFTGEAVAACVVLQDSVAAEHASTGPLERIAADLRRHVHDTLGGLAQPHTVAFVEAFPAPHRGETLRQALTALCSAATDPVLRVSHAQLALVLPAEDDGA